LVEAILIYSKAPYENDKGDRYSRQQRLAALKVAIKYLKSKNYAPDKAPDILRKIDDSRQKSSQRQRDKRIQMFGTKGSRTVNQEELLKIYKNMQDKIHQDKLLFNSKAKELIGNPYYPKLLTKKQRKRIKRKKERNKEKQQQHNVKRKTMLK